MPPLPAGDPRTNLATWAVPTPLAPAVANILTRALPVEAYDPAFAGQELQTTYLDTREFDLRRARQQGERYLTLRVRCYQPSDTYALSAKTEESKFRIAIDERTAAALLGADGNDVLPNLLPAHLLERLLDLAGGRPLVPVTTVCFRRYAVEDDIDRFTLDLGIATDAGKRLPMHVLEFKSRLAGAQPPPALTSLPLRPIKLSKFLWATRL
jgi:hypothetical protein